jgi:hypothetical protein
MQPRPIEEIEKAFREMGLGAKERGGLSVTPEGPKALEPLAEPEPQIFVRIHSTTTPLKTWPDANLA